MVSKPTEDQGLMSLPCDQLDLIVACAALSTHAYNNHFDSMQFIADCGGAPMPLLTPVELLKERCWVLLGKGAAQTSKLFVAFRGTDSLHDMVMDFDMRRQFVPQFNANVHRGFWVYYDDVRKELLRIIDKCGDVDEVIVTGHSLGGAAATFLTLELSELSERLAPLHAPNKCITFGTPPSGSRDFVARYNSARLESFLLSTPWTLPPSCSCPTSFMSVIRSPYPSPPYPERSTL